MRIAELHIHQVELPVKNGPYTMANAEVWSLTSTLVRIVSDTGVEGWGETCPVGPTYAEAHAPGAKAALEAMAPRFDTDSRFKLAAPLYESRLAAMEPPL